MDAFAVTLDTTHEFDIREADRPQIERIVSVYVLDRSNRTGDSRYWLHHCYDEVRLQPWVVDENVAQTVRDHYENRTSEDRHIACDVIDAILAQIDDPNMLGEVESFSSMNSIAWESVEEAMEALRESVMTNRL
jgi:hypothetical protein